MVFVYTSLFTKDGSNYNIKHTYIHNNTLHAYTHNRKKNE